jgi:hypothetical protein
VASVIPRPTFAAVLEITADRNAKSVSGLLEERHDIVSFVSL